MNRLIIFDFNRTLYDPYARGGWQTIWVRAGKFAGEQPDADKQPTCTVASLAEVAPLL